MKPVFRALFSNQLGKIRYSAGEWLIMRFGFAIAIWFATWHTARPWAATIRDSYEKETANGIPALIDLSWLGQPIPTAILAWGMLALLIIYVAGKALLGTTALLSILHALVGGLHSSPAGTHHATQVVGLILIGQLAWFTWERFRGRSEAQGDDDRLDSGSGAIFWSQQMICAGYVVSAISKWINSGGGWIPGANWVSQLPNIAVQFEKNRLQAYYDLLQDPVTNEINREAIRFLAEQPGLAMASLSFGFYVELFAFLALFNRVSAFLVGVGLIALHLFIFAIMSLPFYYFEAVDLIFFLNLPFWLAWIAGKRKLEGASLPS